MDDNGQRPEKQARTERTEDSQDRSVQRPTVHVAPSGSVYVELNDLVPYFLPTEEEVRSYIDENKEEIRGYIKQADANIERDNREDGMAISTD